MSNFLQDNVLLQFPLTLENLCALSELRGPTTIRPEHMPLLVGVEPVRDKNAPPNMPQIASRYNIIFPGSNYLRLAVKVEETMPSVTQELLEKYPGGIRVNMQGFVGGTFLTNDGGARPYFKAAKITPMQASK